MIWFLQSELWKFCDDTDFFVSNTPYKFRHILERNPVQCVDGRPSFSSVQHIAGMPILCPIRRSVRDVALGTGTTCSSFYNLRGNRDVTPEQYDFVETGAPAQMPRSCDSGAQVRVTTSLLQRTVRLAARYIAARSSSQEFKHDEKKVVSWHKHGGREAFS